LVARLNGVQKVVSSNLTAPTIFNLFHHRHAPPLFLAIGLELKRMVKPGGEVVMADYNHLPLFSVAV
jgi:hypothetical protein